MNGSGLLNRWKCMENHDMIAFSAPTKSSRAQYPRVALVQWPDFAFCTMGWYVSKPKVLDLEANRTQQTPQNILASELQFWVPDRPRFR